MMTVSTSPTGHGDRGLEWLFAALMVLWGLYVLAPLDTFRGAQYALMASIAPESVWGAFSLSLGFVRLVALWINGAWRRTPAIRVASSILGVMWWSALGFLLVAGPEHAVPAGVVYYLGFIGAEIFSCWRSAADAFHQGTFRVRARAHGEA